MKPDSDDLSSLIEAASREAAREPAGRLAAQHVRRRPAGIPMLALATLLVISAGWALWTHLGPPGTAQVQADLENTIELARQSVDDARRGSGALPAALPNAALAAVVDYTPSASGYRLETSMLGIHVTLEADGTRHTVRK